MTFDLDNWHTGWPSRDDKSHIGQTWSSHRNSKKKNKISWVCTHVVRRNKRTVGWKADRNWKLQVTRKSLVWRGVREFLVKMTIWDTQRHKTKISSHKYSLTGEVEESWTWQHGTKYLGRTMCRRSSLNTGVWQVQPVHSEQHGSTRNRLEMEVDDVTHDATQYKDDKHSYQFSCVSK